MFQLESRYISRHRSVAKHWFFKPGIGSSNLTGGFILNGFMVNVVAHFVRCGSSSHAFYLFVLFCANAFK